MPGFCLSLFPWLGFSAGPIAAQAVAAAILGREPEVEISRLRTGHLILMRQSFAARAAS